jgi:hypothetical protein
MRENLTTSNTWCPIAGFRALKIFLAFAVECQQRVYQLDYVAAFLKADVIGRKFTIFPSGWKEVLKDYPDLHQWFGVPLRLRKSLLFDESIPECCNSFSVSSASTLVRTSRIVLERHPVHQIDLMSHVDFGLF